MISEIFIKILDELKSINRKLAPGEWESISQAEKILGIPRKELMFKIHNGQIPWRMNGTRYILNLKLAQEYISQEDIRNMETVKKDIARRPFDNGKADTRAIAGRSRPNPNIRPVR